MIWEIRLIIDGVRDEVLVIEDKAPSIVRRSESLIDRFGDWTLIVTRGLEPFVNSFKRRRSLRTGDG